MTPRSTTSIVLRAVLVVLAVVGTLWLLWLVRQPLSWIVLATFVAVAVSGPVNVLARRMPRGLAILLTYLGMLAIPAGILAIIVPTVVRESRDLVDNAPQYATDIQEWVQQNQTLRRLDEDFQITEALTNQARTLPGRAGDAAAALGDVGLGIVNSAFAAITILILSVFLVSSGGRWLSWVINQGPPRHAPRLQRALQGVFTAVGGYVIGALAQATVAGLTTWIVLEILGVPNAAALAVVVGLFDLIPLVGATIASVVVGVVTLFNDFPTDTIIWTVWAIFYQQIENTVIQPQIQKRAVDVHPFIVLVAVLFGSSLFGIAGALLAVPFAASIQVVVREWWRYRRELGLTPPRPPASLQMGEAEEGVGGRDLPAPGTQGAAGSTAPPAPA
jgi:predicted PurR-regulated permease PerM